MKVIRPQPIFTILHSEAVHHDGEWLGRVCPQLPHWLASSRTISSNRPQMLETAPHLCQREKSATLTLIPLQTHILLEHCMANHIRLQCWSISY